MTIELLTAFFGWCSIINIAVLTLSTIAIVASRKFVTNFHARLFPMDEATLTAAYFQYLGQYKIITLTLNVTPYIALRFLV